MKRKYYVGPDSPRIYKYNQVTADILRAMRKHGCKSVRDLALKANHSHDTVRSHLDAMAESGLIGREPKPDTWVYFIKEEDTKA